MKEYIVRLYQKEDFNIWNAFINQAKNATFLFHRDFMEYHSDRFLDYSLMVFDDKKLTAVFPANKVDEVVYSHQGLTYGGLVIDNTLKGIDIENILDTIVLFCRERGCNTMIIKEFLSIYAKNPSYELNYFLIQRKAHLYRRDMNLAIDFRQPSTISKSKLKHFRRVSSLGIEYRKDNNFQLFWQEVLIPRLKEKHNTHPVHNQEEILFLHQKFPENIVQYNAYYDNEIIAGITLFIFDNVIKSQYGATTQMGEKLRALDFLFINIINTYKNQFHFFDMGTVVENDGLSFNRGLLNQKEELGCAIYNQDFYSLIL